MNRLALGTAQFRMHYGIANTSGQVSREDAKAILDFAHMNRIDTVDTAIAYGESEEYLGDFGVEKFRIITKLPPVPENITDVDEWIGNQVESSLLKLKADNLYGLLLHSSAQFRVADVRNSLTGLKKSGKVKKIGVSIYSPDELDSLQFVGELDIVQAPLNLVDRRLVTSGWLDRLNGYCIEVHARSAFLQGLLLMPNTSIPEHFTQWKSIWDTWHKWLSSNDMTPVQPCLGFALSFPEIDKVVVGVETVHQLNQLIEIASMPINFDFPDISSTEEKLMNPSLWPSL